MERAAAHRKNCRVLERLTLSISWRTVSCGIILLLEQGKSVRHLPPEDEGMKNMCDELSLTPTPHPLLPLEGEKVENQE